MDLLKKGLGLILLFFAAVTISAQEEEFWWQGKKVVDIEFKGLQNVSENDLEGIVSEYIDKELDDTLLIELQTALYQLEYFDIIIPYTPYPGDEAKTTVILTFQVQEMAVVKDIEFEGNDAIWDMTLKDAMLLKKDDVVTQDKIDDAVESIKEAYLDKGFVNAKVEITQTLHEEENKVSLNVFIVEGLKTAISEILFYGNDNFADDDTLLGVMETKKKSFFNDGTYKEDVFQRDISMIEAYYHNRGYIKAGVRDVKKETKPHPEKEDQIIMIISIYLDEGDQYRYGGINFFGNEIYSISELDEVVKQVPGEVYNKAKFQSDYRRVADLYLDNGYIFNLFNNVEIIDEETKYISHEITITEKGRAHIGRIILKGNERTKDFVILREIPFEVGDVFSKQKIQQAQQRIYGLRSFSNITIEPQRGEAEGLMDLVFNLEERSTIAFSFGVSVDGDFNPSGILKLSDTNFLGQAITASIEGNFSTENQELKVVYHEPRLFGTHFSGGVELAYNRSSKKELLLGTAADPSDTGRFPHPFTGSTAYEESTGSISDDDKVDSESHDIKLGFTTGYFWNLPETLGRLYLNTRYSISMGKTFYDGQGELYDEDLEARREGWTHDDNWRTRLRWDNLNRPFGTTDGYLLTQELTFGGVLPGIESQYFKTKTTASVFFPLWNVEVNESWNFEGSLKLHSSYTRLFGLGGSDVPQDSRLMIDGMFIGRGWQRTNQFGTALLNTGVSVDMPIITGLLGASLFVDGFRIWSEYEDHTNFELDNWMFTTGFSLGIINQMLPISVYIGRAFKIEDGGINWNPEGSAGANIPGGLHFNITFYLDPSYL